MSLLTTKIRKAVGKGMNGYGRGQSWLYVNGTGDEDGRAKVEENERTIRSLIDNFETYKLVQRSGNEELVQYISFIYNSRTSEYVGSCKVDRWRYNATDGARYIVVDYTNGDKESIVSSAQKSNGFVSFERVD